MTCLPENFQRLSVYLPKLWGEWRFESMMACIGTMMWLTIA
jgi:hypothetical protein